MLKLWSNGRPIPHGQSEALDAESIAAQRSGQAEPVCSRCDRPLSEHVGPLHHLFVYAPKTGRVKPRGWC